MPPKGWKKYADGFRPANSSGAPLEDRPVYRLEDLLLPRTSVAKYAKEVLPEKTALPKDGVTALLRSSTVFISYIAAEANHIAIAAGRKTVSPADIMRALERTHFAAFVGPVQERLEAQQRALAERKARGEHDPEEDIQEDEETDAASDSAKRARVDAGVDAGAGADAVGGDAGVGTA